jgi:hypothetical protein
VEESEVVASGFLETRRDGAISLEVVEKDLDEVARQVELAVER